MIAIIFYVFFSYSFTIGIASRQKLEKFNVILAPIIFPAILGQLLILIAKKQP